MPMTDAIRACLLSLALLAVNACAVPSKISGPEGPVNFGRVLVPMTATEPLSMTTWGSQPITVAELRATGEGLKQFTLPVPDGGFPVSVTPPEPFVVPVTFAPKTKGRFNTLISPAVTGSESANFPARAVGEGVFDIRKGYVTMAVVGTEGLDFGEPFIGVKTELPIAFINRSEKPRSFAILKPGPDSAFRTNIKGTRVWIPPGGRVTYTVTFQPRTDEAQLDMIMLKVDDENYAGITLRGKGRRRG
ncbi:MAG: hypothetical protein QNJ94_04055 [Alphaproteobacteria bacterium]|nr:hypothetical protein [Alphaproteobacteria bacterium]